MLSTKLEKDRDAIFDDLIQTARDFRFHHRLDFDHVVQVKIPEGVKHLITRRDIEHLRVFWIEAGDYKLVQN